MDSPKKAEVYSTSDGVEARIGSKADAPGKKDDKKDGKEVQGPLSSASQVFSEFGRSRKVVSYRIFGVICSVISGCAYPAMAFYFSKSFEKLGAQAANGGSSFMDDIVELAITFVILGAVGFVFLVLQSAFLEIAASESAADYKIRWFNALLRQDMAYYDIKDVSAQATIVAASAARYKKGTGRKLGEGIQFTTTVLGGFIFAFYVSWRVSLLILVTVPLMAGASIFVMTVNTKQTENKNKNYAETGGIVYTTISAIRTVFSLNATETMITKFEKATQKVYDNSVSFTYLVGLGNGAMMGSFLVSYIVLTLYGTYLLYSDVEKDGCDPSNTLGDLNKACGVVGFEVFGALMGISFGAMGLAQISNAIEAFMSARAACHPALEAINRTVKNDEDKYIEDVEAPPAVASEKRSDIVLPKYVIDSSSTEGKKPNTISGEIELANVSFAYPTRPNTLVFNGLSLKIEAGKTVALVGPSGGGKSTTVAMLERFYDPTSGSIMLDGVDLREINVRWLRDNIGLVSQEPVLFARTIYENIAYGMSGATEEDIIRAAKSANAHDFISQFPNGYHTEVGDKGAQLSGGQKQRIAIARVLLKNPKILLLDEATSALDSESEYVVQEALDDLMGEGNRTTIVIAHRLSTIRNADMIAVVKDGRIVETGSHDELVKTKGSEYGKLVEAQAPKKVESGSALATPDSSALYDGITKAQISFRDVHFHYPSRPNNKIFEGLNLNIKQGETLAIVGPSGGGKSTVVQMVERFYDPLEGSVEYEGTDLKDINIKWYRDQIGFVSQEPTLFNTTIEENIRYGYAKATQAEIEEAAKQANAHDFIMSFPNGYKTDVGENATQVSGGQKQRIAIARAILKKPKILILDEATSALDNESEKIVQGAIDNLMRSKNQTIIVIAHRLSTIQDADRIAVIADGVLQEIGSHNELIGKPNGRYKRLVTFQDMTGNEKKKTIASKDDDDDDYLIDVSVHGNDDEADEDKEKVKIQKKRAQVLAKEDLGLFFVGTIGAILAGLVFPGWGVVFAFMIDLLFHPVFPCDEEILQADEIPEYLEGYASCQEYWDYESDWLKDTALNVTWGWVALCGATIIGNVLLFYGFGTATEKMNKRVRDAVFTALMRQDISYYDTHSVAKLASQIEDDAGMIASFSGEPIRTLWMSVASVLVGLALSFFYMWPFALLTMAILPAMGFGAYMEMKMYLGEDEGADAPEEGKDSAGAIVVETLLSIRTVASLTIEKLRTKEYTAALQREDPASVKTNLLKGLATGVGFLVQLWGMALMFWWGGWLLNKYPNTYDYLDFNISMFALLFSLSGLSVAMMGITDQAKAKKAAERIFALIDRESPINSLSDTGKKVV